MPGEKSRALRAAIGWREFLGFCCRDNLIEWQFFALFRIFHGPIFRRSGSGLCARAFIPELGHQPLKPAQIFLETDLRIFISVIQNTYRSAPAAITNNAQQLQIEFALSERPDELSVLIAVTDRSI